MRRSGWMLASVLLSACATDPVTTGDAGGALEAAPTGLFHLPMTVDATNLELLADNTFRWSISGCDFFGGDKGRVSVEADELVLLPAEGASTFLWNNGELSSRVSEVRLEVSEGGLIDSQSGQSWVAGGVCSICGGGLGPSGQEPCGEPSFFDP